MAEINEYKKITAGDQANEGFFNDAASKILTGIGLNTIRQAQNRSIDFSNNETDSFVEAFIDSNGRFNTVVGNTTLHNKAEYISSDLVFGPSLNFVASTDTTNDPESFNNPDNAFDDDTTTYADKSYSGDGADSLNCHLGKTFSERDILKIYINASLYVFSNDGTSNDNVLTIYLETYDGSSWSTEATLATLTFDGSGAKTITYNSFYELNKSVQGIRIYFYTNSGSTNYSTIQNKLYYLDYGENYTYGDLTLNITSGRLKNDITSAYLTALVDDWKTTNNITYKIINSSGDDSGWLNLNELSSITQFTSEPEQIIIRLTPETNDIDASPTIKGVYLKAW